MVGVWAVGTGRPPVLDMPDFIVSEALKPGLDAIFEKQCKKATLGLSQITYAPPPFSGGLGRIWKNDDGLLVHCSRTFVNCPHKQLHAGTRVSLSGA